MIFGLLARAVRIAQTLLHRKGDRGPGTHGFLVPEFAGRGSAVGPRLCITTEVGVLGESPGVMAIPAIHEALDHRRSCPLVGLAPFVWPTRSKASEGNRQTSQKRSPSESGVLHGVFSSATDMARFRLRF